MACSADPLYSQAKIFGGKRCRSEGTQKVVGAIAANMAVNPAVPRQLMAIIHPISSRRVAVIVVADEYLEAKPELPHLGIALYSQSLGFGGCQRGEQQRGQYANDGDDYQEFNQSKPRESSTGCGWVRLFHGNVECIRRGSPFG